MKVETLAARVNRELAARFGDGQAHVRLQLRVLGRCVMVLALDDIVGLLEAGLDIAEHNLAIGPVAPHVEIAFGPHLGRVGLDRLQHVEHGRLFFDLVLDLLRGFPGRVLALCCDDGHQLAFMAERVRNQHRLIAAPAKDVDLQIFGGQDARNTGRFFGLGTYPAF